MYLKVSRHQSIGKVKYKTSLQGFGLQALQVLSFLLSDETRHLGFFCFRYAAEVYVISEGFEDLDFRSKLWKTFWTLTTRTHAVPQPRLAAPT